MRANFHFQNELDINQSYSLVSRRDTVLHINVFKEKNPENFVRLKICNYLKLKKFHNHLVKNCV